MSINIVRAELVSAKSRNADLHKGLFATESGIFTIITAPTFGHCRRHRGRIHVVMRSSKDVSEG